MISDWRHQRIRIYSNHDCAPAGCCVFTFPNHPGLAENPAQLRKCDSDLVFMCSNKPGMFTHPLLKCKCPHHCVRCPEVQDSDWRGIPNEFPHLLPLFESFMHSPPILHRIVSFSLMSCNLHICFISSSRAPHLFIFPVCVLGVYLLSERTFSITSSAFMMFLLAFLFYYTS